METVGVQIIQYFYRARKTGVQNSFEGQEKRERFSSLSCILYVQFPVDNLIDDCHKIFSFSVRDSCLVVGGWEGAIGGRELIGHARNNE